MRLHTGAAVITLSLAMWTSAFAQLTAAQREPTLHVRASTRLELNAQPGTNLVRIEGRLSDDLDQPLRARSVVLTLMAADGDAPASRTLRTDEDGRFVQQLTRGTGRYTLRARYAGDGLHEPIELDQTFDVTRTAVQLSLALGRGQTIALDEAETSFELRAVSAAGAEGLLVDLRDETGRSLSRGTTDAQGVWRGVLQNSTLGAPGPGEWTAASEEDDERAAGRAVTSVLRQRATQLVLTAAYDDERSGARARGSVRTKIEPLARAPVGLFIDGEHAQTVLTDDLGAFDVLLPIQAGARSTTRHVSARFDSDRPGVLSSRSPEQPVVVPARPGPNLLWILLPTLASLGLSWLLLRRSDSWLGRRPSAPSFEAGVQLGAVQRRAPNQYEMDGVIEDADTAARLHRAALRIARSDGLLIAAQVQRDGSFSIPKLAPGSYRLEARAPGYALEATEVRVPHAGEGRGLRVRLRSLRALALEAHRPLLRRVFPSREQQHTATVRETLRSAPSHWPRAMLEPLSELVEQTAYASDEPTADEVRAIEARTHELMRDKE